LNLAGIPLWLDMSNGFDTSNHSISQENNQSVNFLSWIVTYWLVTK